MQTVSQTYADLLAADARREIKAVIGGVDYGEDKLVSVEASVSLMQTLAIGNAVAAQIDLAIWNPGQIARMAEIDLYVRLNDGATQSEWLPKGVYYIDTREYDEETDVLTIHGFDSMLKADQPYFQGGTVGVWPRAANVVVADICTRLGVTLSADTTVSTANMVEFPNEYTMREVLSHVAAAQGGNWCFADDGKLRLLPLNASASTLISLVPEAGAPSISTGLGIFTKAAAAVPTPEQLRGMRAIFSDGSSVVVDTIYSDEDFRAKRAAAWARGESLWYIDDSTSGSGYWALASIAYRATVQMWGVVFPSAGDITVYGTPVYVEAGIYARDPLLGGAFLQNGICYIGNNVTSLETSPALAAISRVTLYYDDTNAFTAGDNTGYALEADCPWATQGIVNAVLASLAGYVYRPFAASDTLVDPALELGDILYINGVTYQLMQMTTAFDALYTADIGAPQDKAIDHEYPYLTPTERALRRKVTLGASYYGTTITRTNGLQIKRSDGASEAIFNSDRFQMSALVDGVMTPRIYFDAAKRDYVFDGALGADAVFTDSLYAEQGDVAELTVDRLSTSRRVRKYILGDTTDDNYIDIQGNYIRFVTGTPIEDTEHAGTYLTEQATNRNSSPLYWQSQPVSHDADGYPLDADGVQIYATTNVTAYPIMQYQYAEQIKARFAFDQVSGTYIPTLTFGSGYGMQDADRGKGFLRKNPDSLDLWLLNRNGERRGIFIGDPAGGGYTDITGLRKATQLDFSDWDNGSFSVAFDGGVTETYGVTFDANSVPVKITDSAGHETEVIW